MNIRGLLDVLDGRLTREESKNFFKSLDSDGDGDIEVFEVQNAIKGRSYKFHNLSNNTFCSILLAPERIFLTPDKR